MASIKKRGNSWRVRVSYKDAQGDYKIASKEGFRTKKEAMIAANEMQKQSFDGTLSKDSNTPFPDYFNQWYQTFKEPMIRDRTKATYVQTSHVIQKYFKNVPIGKITRSSYQTFLSDFGKNHSKETVNKRNSHIHAAVKNALYDGVIRRDFVANTTPVFDKKRTRKISYLNIEELNRLVRHLKDGLNPNYTSRFMILTAVYTGMRLGEIQGLEWQDINFNFKMISIKRSWNDASKEFGPTKNESSIRTIRVNKELLDVLKVLPKGKPTDQVFINQFGTVPTSRAVNNKLTDLLKETKIKRAGFHFHSLRHTHVAYLLANNIDLYVISKRLGHSDIGTTSRQYSYLIDEYKARTDDQIENTLSHLGGDDNDKWSKNGQNNIAF